MNEKTYKELVATYKAATDNLVAVVKRLEAEGLTKTEAKNYPEAKAAQEAAEAAWWKYHKATGG